MERKVIATQPGLAPTTAATAPVIGAAPIGGTKVLQTPVVGAPVVATTTAPIIGRTTATTTTGVIPTDSRMAAAKTTMAMAQGIAAGVPPTNQQMTSVISGTENVLHQQAATLPPAGQKAAHDAAVLLQDVRQVITEKNAGNELQGLVTDFAQLGSTAKSTAATAAGATGGAAGATGMLKDKTSGLRQQLSEPMRNFMMSSKSLMKGFVRNQDIRNDFRDLIAAFQWAFYQRSQSNNQLINSNWGGYTNGNWNWGANTYGSSIPTSTGFGAAGITTVIPETIAPAVVTTTVQQPASLFSTPVAPATTGLGFQTLPQQPQRFDNYTPMTEGEESNSATACCPSLFASARLPSHEKLSPTSSPS